jgi:hypothetical protein
MGRTATAIGTETARPTPVPAERLKPSDFLAEVRSDPDSLIYFVLNVGDGDTQLIVLPVDSSGIRRAIVVDVATTRKLSALIESLSDPEQGILKQPEDGLLFPVVIGTHPHDDHLGGMPEFLDRFHELIGEYWEPGFYHPSGSYVEVMRAVEAAHMQHLQPTSGTTRFLGKAKLTALSPGIGLRNRFDTYGTQINDASIALRVEYPAARITQDGENRHYLPIRDPWCIILGADAQTTSWAQAILDFPRLDRRSDALARALRAALGRDLFRAQVFKIPHHASKHGLNIELVERIAPRLCLISSTDGTGRYGFPHRLAVEAIREAQQPLAANRGDRKPDHDLGIHYTSASDDSSTPRPLGSIALMVPAKRGARLRLWRFGDRAGEPVGLGAAMEMVRPSISK